MAAEQEPVTRLLQRALGGDTRAADELEPLLYVELKDVAHRMMAGEQRSHTLQPTALVHEAWLRLQRDGAGGPPPTDRAYFLGVAARVMRRILVDHARAKKAGKRGGGNSAVPLDEVEAIERAIPVDVLALHEILQRLVTKDPQLARIVELRYFAGMTLEETGEALGLTVRQVHRAWTLARSWLHRELSTADGLD